MCLVENNEYVKEIKINVKYEINISVNESCLWRSYQARYFKTFGLHISANENCPCLMKKKFQLKSKQ